MVAFGAVSVCLYLYDYREKLLPSVPGCNGLRDSLSTTALWGGNISFQKQRARGTVSLVYLSHGLEVDHSAHLPWLHHPQL